MSSTPHPTESLRILLLRHPKTDWNTEQRYQGSTDRPWASVGQTQAEHLASNSSLPEFDTIIHSPRSHARGLAEKLTSEPALLCQDKRWAEVDHGDWEGLTYEEVSQRFPQSCEERFANSHGGETLQELSNRVLEAWKELPNRNNGPDIAIVTHATPIQVVLCHISGLPLERHWQFRIDCGSITSLEVTSSGTIINFSNRL